MRRAAPDPAGGPLTTTTRVDYDQLVQRSDAHCAILKSQGRFSLAAPAVAIGELVFRRKLRRLHLLLGLETATILILITALVL
jgi:hypothetical protein